MRRVRISRLCLDSQASTLSTLRASEESKELAAVLGVTNYDLAGLSEDGLPLGVFSSQAR